MKMHWTWGLVASALLLMVGRQAVADSVLVLGGNSTNDNAAALLLEADGHTVTVNNNYATFTGGLTGYNAVVLLSNFTSIGSDMDPAGQTALVSFVQGGGGLVTSEWTNWSIAAEGFLQTLKVVMPVVPSTIFNYSTPITYTQATANATLDAGLPSSFTFNADNNGGTGRTFSRRPARRFISAATMAPAAME